MTRKRQPEPLDLETVRQQRDQAKADLAALERQRKQQARVSFGVRLKALREEAGLSLAELERKSMVSNVNLSRYELGQRQPTWAIVLALADALGTSTEAFRE
jgi:DNA-binding XRE family transcriptional regulator